jgi:hypothetical protein
LAFGAHLDSSLNFRYELLHILGDARRHG